ncbi:hypothetical protein [Aestuariicoccus sp. MJ-SS9]|uniref:hypothetical protein n=1 Tax=Aestuariicoccus sp. MJ-SS9 TaxID=3079855 RepID=UPI00290F1515|nr:hypothetical protein [Aestuariicoccus sp. MJ-SS9]MDU8911031.1 hypothetical protein [Aestuariicoccus sp. MJ-SS9]
MSLVQDMADALAEDVLKIQDELGEDRFYMEVAKELAASSTTLEEAFLTSIRVRLSERRARAFINNHIDAAAKALRAGEAVPQARSVGSDNENL